MGYLKYSYDKDGYDENGFTTYNHGAIHKDTGTTYNPEGYNKKGYDKKGYNKEGYNKAGYDKEGYDKNGYNSKGYNREGYDRTGFDRNGVSKEGINKKTGEKDERVKFAEEFISFGESIEAFAEHKQISVEQAKAIMDEIRTSSVVNEKLESAFGKKVNRIFAILTAEKEKLLLGEIAIADIKDINKILKLSTIEERKKIRDMLIKAIASHEISILQYKDIFGIKEINSSLPQNIIIELYKAKRFAGPLAREVYNEIDRLKPYRAPYIAGDGETLGYREKPTDKNLKMVAITDEHRNMARQYLSATDEFICSKTMQVTLMKIVKGEIGIEQIVRAKKESELRRLQQKDEELGELIYQSEQLIKNSQGKTRNTFDIDVKGV